MEETDFNIQLRQGTKVDFVMMEKYMITPASVSKIDAIEYQKAKGVLNSFQHILWIISSNILELDDECKMIMNEELSYAVEVLDKFDYRMNLEKLEGKLIANQETRLMARLLIISMLKVKEYPSLGKYYYEVLQKTYLLKEKMKETDILYEMNISRSTYYKYKKEAVRIFGYYLWQVILPNLRKTTEETIPIIGSVYASRF